MSSIASTSAQRKEVKKKLNNQEHNVDTITTKALQALLGEAHEA